MAASIAAAGTCVPDWLLAILPADGTSLPDGQLAGSQSDERRKAFAQWSVNAAGVYFSVFRSPLPVNSRIRKAEDWESCRG